MFRIVQRHIGLLAALLVFLSGLVPSRAGPHRGRTQLHAHAHL